MDYHQYHKFLNEGIGIIPVRTNGIGEQVQVIYEKGESDYVRTNTESYVERLAESLGYSMKHLRKACGGILGKRQYVPLVLTKRVVLVPFHCHQSTNLYHRKGWLLLQAMRQASVDEQDERKTLIELKNGYMVTVYQSLYFVNEQWKNADYVQLKYRYTERI